MERRTPREGLLIPLIDIIKDPSKLNESLMVSSKGYGWKHFEPVVMQLDQLLIEAGLDIIDCYTEEE